MDACLPAAFARARQETNRSCQSLPCVLFLLTCIEDMHLLGSCKLQNHTQAVAPSGLRAQTQLEHSHMRAAAFAAVCSHNPRVPGESHTSTPLAGITRFILGPRMPGPAAQHKPSSRTCPPRTGSPRVQPATQVDHQHQQRIQGLGVHPPVQPFKLGMWMLLASRERRMCEAPGTRLRMPELSWNGVRQTPHANRAGAMVIPRGMTAIG